MSNSLSDISAEEAVLTGLIVHGKEALVDVQDIIGPNSFTETINSVAYTCLSHMYDNSYEFDIPAFLSSAKTLGLTELVATEDKLAYIQNLASRDSNLDNVRKHAVKLSKIGLIRKLQAASRQTYQELAKLSGSESIDTIMATAEKEIFAATMELNGRTDTNVEVIGEDLEEYLEWLEENECDQIGVPSPYPRWGEVTGGGFRRGTTTLFGARPKTGKMQPLDSIVYTTSGPKRMGDISIGEELCSPDGSITTVDGIYPQSKKDIYRVHFCDKTYSDCGLEHLWKVAKNRRNKYEYQVLSLEDIIKEGLYYADRPKWKIPVCEKVFFEERDIKIDPYILGCLLGDGGITNNTPVITSSDEEILKSFSRYLEPLGMTLNHKQRYDYSISKDTSKSQKVGINIITHYLRKYKLFGCNSHNKFIPDDYKYNSVENRLGLVRGLMDTDGSNSGGKYAEYTSVSKQLIDDISEVIRSLGYKCVLNSRYTSYTGSNKKFKSYRIYISGENVNDLFSLKRKKYSESRTKGRIFKKIIKVEKLPNKLECRCISVSNCDGLYLTDSLNVTHNTTVAKDIAYYAAKNNIPVLVLDTEMNSKDQKNKLLASISKVGTNLIERGKFGKDPQKRSALIRASRELKDLKYYYKSICGKGFDDVLSIIRRWIFQYVGFDDEGNTNDCLVIYDYFKLQEAEKLKEVQEYQALGFQIADMTNFCIQHDIPTVAFVQLNREGIEKESTSAISQSDRLLWLCSSFTMIKRKTEEEIEEDGIKYGNMKFIPLEARFGPGMKDGDYISVWIDGATSSVEEKRFKSEIIRKDNGNSGKIAD